MEEDILIGSTIFLQQNRYRFDSPPKETETGISGGNTSALLQSIQTIALAQAAKVDRKLYIGNLPPGITPPVVSLILELEMIVC